MPYETLNIRQDELPSTIDYHMACFVDILGMRNKLNLVDNDEEKLLEIHSILKEFYSNFNGYMIKKYDNFTWPQINLFSDCAYLSVPPYSTQTGFAHSSYDYYGIIINGLAFAQGYMLLHHNIFIRGGISFGTCIYSQNLEVSSAYYNAYKIESEVATYPIIAIHGLSSDDYETLKGLDAYGGERNVGNPNEDILIDLNLPEFKGKKLYMLNYLYKYMLDTEGFINSDNFIEVISNHKEKIIAAHNENTNKRIKEKYYWLGMTYHNYFLKKYPNIEDSLIKDFLINERDFITN